VSVTREQVLEIAALARLHLSEAEARRYADQLSSILAHVAELAAADTAAGSQAPRVRADTAVSGAVVFHHGTGATSTTPRPAGGVLGVVRAPRPDEPPPDTLQFPAAELSADWQDGFFTVPRLAALDPGAADAGE